MACASVMLTEERVRCAICLDVFTDPITILCGHNYCKTCITHYWDTNEVCQCPVCKRKFPKRPEVFVNNFISEMAEQFRQSQQQPAADEDEVSCDVCIEAKLKAMKSCLVCMASFCENHLDPHQRVSALKRHKLIDPVKDLEEIICKKHERPLELFCKTDHMCICQFCTESDHKSHQIVSLEEECEGKKAELRKTEAEVQQMIQERQVKIQEVKHSLEISKKDADKETTDTCVQVLHALMSCIEKHKTMEKQAKCFIKELQKEITDLKKRSSELKSLSNTEDHLHILQQFTSINTPPPTKDWTKDNVHQSSHVGTVSTKVVQLEKTLSQEMKKLYDAELRRIQQYAVDVTLDPDTAHCRLILSEDGKRVYHGDVKKSLPNNKERFSYCTNVLGKESFSSGRLYYEVQIKDKTDWVIGVARESINRKGFSTRSPNNGYWTIWLRNGTEYKAAAGPDVLLLIREELQKVGVFVDYEEGLVSFFDVETRVHIYSFTGCTFTEKLFPVFSPDPNYNGKNSSPLIISLVKAAQTRA